MKAKGQWDKGTYTPVHMEKYIGRKVPITYRSSWEKRMFVFSDYAPHIKKWSSEDIKIPYTFNLDDAGRQVWHQYIPDLYWEIEDPLDKSIKRYLIEIKPAAQTKEPNKPKTKNAKSWKRYEYQMLVYIQNDAKWKFANAYCEKHNIKFKIITESTIFRAEQA